jgi:hypothetical protein
MRRKACRDCGAVKLLRHFYRHPTYSDGHMNSCKVCKRAYAREMHELKRDQILARKRVYSATPAQRAARALYAASPRGREVMNRARREYRAFQRIALPESSPCPK